MTRTSDHWKVLPGRFDSVNARWLFASGNHFGIPALKAYDGQIPKWLVPYRTRVRTKEDPLEGAVHFFLDDYYFERVWARPIKTLSAVAQWGRALTPDFSLFLDWPLAIQLWNVYRSRWCGAYWQSHGVQVIPTVSWSDEQSYEFCFEGIQKGGVVAVSSVGTRLGEAPKFFEAGYTEMVMAVEPKLVLCYGQLPEGFKSPVEVEFYPTRWDGIKRARSLNGANSQ